MIIHARASAFLDSFKMLKAGRKTTEKTDRANNHAFFM